MILYCNLQPQRRRERGHPAGSKETMTLLETESYDYALPLDLIAQHPVTPRDAARLLVVSRKEATCRDYFFRDLPELLSAGDILVLNSTRVLPARLQSDRGEVLLIREEPPGCWDAIVRPGKNFKPGTKVQFAGGFRAEVVKQSPSGRILRFSGNARDLMIAHGKVPLPPYIDREPEPRDKVSYQTIYARENGSVAAPTAGLHFTRRVFRNLKERRIPVVRLTLHVGPGTFRPVKTTDITKHRVDPEYYSCSPAVWSKIQKADRVIAVGTTTTRALESIARTGQLKAFTDLFIFPGFDFRIVGGLVTNFHLPKSSLLMLVSAFAGYDLTRKAYNYAVDGRYRFYSYGDAMLLL